MSRHRQESRGFTLVELMVSITILTMIVIMFSQSLGSVSSIWGRAQEKMDNYAKARTLLNRLQVDFQSLVPREDLPNFGAQGNGESVLGFYTLQRGFSSNSGGNSRPLSYVEYLPGNDEKGLSVLNRLNRPFDYAASPDFLPAPTPDPGATPTPPSPTPIDSGGLDHVTALRGLLAFSYGFLHPDGQYSSNFYENSSGQPSRAVAVTVGMVVVDNRTEELLEKRGDLGKLSQDLSLSAPPSGSNWSPKAIWDYQLGLSAARPAGSSASRITGNLLLDSVRTFERTFPIPSSNL
jgi:prepilin-type N-terminal cleavage/methylation domain